MGCGKYFLRPDVYLNINCFNRIGKSKWFANISMYYPIYVNHVLVIRYNDVYLGCRKLFTDIGKWRMNVHFTCKTTRTFCLFLHDVDGSGSINPQPSVIQDNPNATNNVIRSYNEISVSQWNTYIRCMHMVYSVTWMAWLSFVLQMLHTEQALSILNYVVTSVWHTNW